MLVGTSGTGKSTLCSVLEKRGAGKRSVSHTTRNKRSGERQGHDYYFVSEEEFGRKLADGDMLEHAEVHGHLYGTSSAWLDEQLANGETILLDIDIQGARQVKERHPDAKVVFLLPPDYGTLEARLRDRHREGEDEIRARLRHGIKELLTAGEFDYLIVNDDLDVCCDEIEGIARDCREGGEGSARLWTASRRELAEKWAAFAQNELESGNGQDNRG